MQFALGVLIGVGVFLAYCVWKAWRVMHPRVTAADRVSPTMSASDRAVQTTARPVTTPPMCEYCGGPIRADDVHSDGTSACCLIRCADGVYRQFYFVTPRWVPPWPTEPRH